MPDCKKCYENDRKLLNVLAGFMPKISRQDGGKMSKGIIVVDDIPSTCKKCDYCDRSFPFECYCIASMSSIKMTDEERPEWCPIHEIPTRLEELKSPYSLQGYQMKGFQRGWNACLNKILEEGG